MLSAAFKQRLSSPWVGRAAAAAGLAGLLLVYLATERTFAVQLGSQYQQYQTHATTVGRALEDIRLSLHTGDVVIPDPGAPLRSGMVIEVRRAFPVRISYQGKQDTIRTTSTVPENILAQAGVRVFPGDRVVADGLPVEDPSLPLDTRPTQVEWFPGVELTIDTGSGTMQLRTSASTVGGALEDAGLKVHQADLVSPSLATPISSLMTISYVPSRPLRILVDGTTVKGRASAGTVGEALGQAGIPLVGLDYSRPAVDQPVPEDGRITVVRVSEQVKVELTPVPFETQYQPLGDVEIDQQRLIKTGAYGVEAHQVRVRYEDGEETSRTEEGTWLAKAAESRIVGYGTNIVIRKVATDDGTIEYWRAVKMWATSYSESRAGVSPDARNFGITASGQPLKKGLVAIDRRYIPFGTRMYVPGYGYALAADTGGGVKGRWIDLGYNDGNYVPWHQYVTVYFLTPVPPESSIVWIFP
jgi:uncharacterized protein YabE (DUF348 family)